MVKFIRTAIQSILTAIKQNTHKTATVPGEAGCMLAHVYGYKRRRYLEPDGLNQLILNYNTEVPSIALVKRPFKIAKDVLTKKTGLSIRHQHRDATLDEFEQRTPLSSENGIWTFFPHSYCNIESSFIKRVFIVPFDAGFLCQTFMLVHVSKFLFAHLKHSIQTAHLKTQVERAIYVALLIDEVRSCTQARVEYVHCSLKKTSIGAGHWILFKCS